MSSRRGLELSNVPCPEVLARGRHAWGAPLSAFSFSFTEVCMAVLAFFYNPPIPEEKERVIHLFSPPSSFLLLQGVPSS